MKQQQKSKRKKKRLSRAPKDPPVPDSQPRVEGDDDERRQRPPPPPPHPQQEQQQQRPPAEAKMLYSLKEAFDSVSLEDAASAHKEANGNVNKAAGILANLAAGEDDPSTSSCSSCIWGSDSGSGGGGGGSGSSEGSSSSSGSSLSSGSSKGFGEANDKGFWAGGRNNKQKRTVAVTGTVSNLLGKDYVKASPARRVGAKDKGFNSNHRAVDKDEAEQFLCSMLGDDCDLSMAVVKDVLCHCGYNVEKALDILLDLSASNETMNTTDDIKFYFEGTDNLTDRASDSASHSSESEDSFWGYGCRNYLQALTNSEAPSSTRPMSNELDPSQKVLDSLFNIPRSSEHELSSMHWRSVVKKMQSLGPGVNVCPSNEVQTLQDTYAKGEEYQQFRKSATQNWESVRSSYRKAAAAYSRGDRHYAAYLSDQGRTQTRLAQVADEQASQDIFQARNRSIENIITIDLHGQHVQHAMRLLKLHLLFGTFVRSIQGLRVITGCGSHGLGKSIIKESDDQVENLGSRFVKVIKLLKQEGIEWREENRGTVIIKVDGQREYSFLDADSDTEESL